jgi:hypothetical protein
MIKIILKVAMLLAFAFITQTGFAAIQLELNNDTPDTMLVVNAPVNLECDSIIKTGPGEYAINVNVTNSGDTIIQEGTLAFLGSSNHLQNVFGGNNNPSNVSQSSGVTQSDRSAIAGNSTIIVGNMATLTALSIRIDTLRIGGSYNDLQTVDVPEPTSIVLWSLLGGLGTVFSWRRRKAA